MALSKNFSLLIESMKSDSFSYELQERRDRKQRQEDRAERREERRQEKFQDDEKDFKLSPFIDSLEALKNSIIADYNDAQQRQNPASNLAGAQTGKKYTTIFTGLLDRVAKLKAEAVYQREKDGRFLEITTDLALINSFRNNYSDLYADFTEASQNYRDEYGKESEKVIADIEYPNITKPLQDAETLFAEAKTEMLKVLDTIKLAAQQLASGSTGVTGSSGTTGGAQSELTSTIKQRSGDAYTGKEGDIVKEVKKLIYEKFKKYDAVSGTTDWSKVYASYPKVSGSLRLNTANVIKDVKNGLRKNYKELENDKTGDITPGFYTVLKNYKEANESLATTPGKLISFDNFIKSKVLEEFDVDAVVSGRNAPRGGSKQVKAKKDPQAEANPPTPFKTKEEGDNFRVYVNEKDPEYAKRIQLDKAGSFDNKFIRKAFAQYGQQYLKEVQDGTYKVSGGTEVKVLSNEQLRKIYEYLKQQVATPSTKWFSASLTGEIKIDLLPSGNTFYIQIYLVDKNEGFLIYTNYTCSYFINYTPDKQGYTRFDADLIIPQGKETDPTSWQATFRDGQGTFSLKDIANGSSSGKISGKDKQKQAEQEGKMKKTYTDAQYQQFVTELLMNMKGINTAYEGGQVQKLFKEKIITQGDLDALNDAWGLKDGDTLKQWLYDDTLWTYVKKILKEKGLDVSKMAAGE